MGVEKELFRMLIIEIWRSASLPILKYKTKVAENRTNAEKLALPTENILKL